MAMQPPVKTSSAHMSTFLRGTHRFDIIGYRKLKALGVRNTVRSGDFEAGGRTWALVCCFDVLSGDSNPPRQCHLASISLKLVNSNHDGTVIAKASLRIDDPAPSGKNHRRWPPAVWESGEAHTFPANTADGSDSNDDDSEDARTWKLSIPHAFRESLYVKDDRLTIHCTVDVLVQEKVDHTLVTTRNCSVSAVPPPTISRDLRNLWQLAESLGTKSKPETLCIMKTDITFVVEQTEIHAHRLVLAMRSPVFAAELLGGMKESAACAHVTIDDMRASTFKAMLYFIYTDELPNSHKSFKHDNMGDLLVAADRYDLERLRLMCEKILAENIDTTSAVTTLMLVHGCDRCQQLEALCIEYTASNPDVVATKEYKELKERCGPFVTDVLEKVWMRSLATRTQNSPSSSSEPTCPQKSASTFNSSEVFNGSHEFRISSFSAIHKMYGVSEFIESGIFHIGGYDWIMRVYPSGYDIQGQGCIGMCLHMLNAPANGWVSATFKIDDPRVQTPPIIRCGERLYSSAGTCYLVKNFMDVTTTKLYYVRNEGSLTIHCDIKVGSTSTTSAVGATTAIIPPPSNIACHLERLLVSPQCYDIKFLVQDSELRAHELVIAVRSPVLHKVISSAPEKDHIRIDDIDSRTFHVMIHFIYTDELPMVMGRGCKRPGNASHATTMIRDLLVAADRFGLDRMKAMCENMLCEQVTSENVVAVLELADRRRCQGLKEFCLDQISQPHVLKEAVETKSFKDLKAASPCLLEEIILKISKLSSINA